jgi:hypothetical protein
MAKVGGAELLGEQRAGEVLVDDGLDPAERAPLIVDDRDPAAAVGDHDRPVVEQQLDRRSVDARERFGRGHDPPPPAVPLAGEPLPLGLPAVHVRLVGEVGTDRLGGRLPGRVVQRHLDPADHGDDGPVEPRQRSS